MDKRDLYIKAKLQEDKKISSQANEIFEKFEGGINLENNDKQKERKILKISLNHAILAFTSLIVVVILGGNLYAHIQGKPNIYSAIKNLFVKEDKYTASEIAVDQTVESNGIKLTLKTVAMDENVLITKYVAEGEKLANEFYTYPEFEEDMIEMAKMNFVAEGIDIGEEKYNNIESSDVTEAYNKMKSRLLSIGLDENEAGRLLIVAQMAFNEYVGTEYLEWDSSEKAKELITKTIAMFESKVSSKYQIMQSNDTLQDFGIKAISQKIERSGNQYIIYNVYNVDTISDLASEFKLNVNVSKIGSTSGTWNFETQLEKARLDTRVETIDFYDNETNVYGNEDDGYIKVSVKKLVISDFSSVLMVQKNSNYYMDGSKESLLKNTYTYVVTDRYNHVLGTGGTVKAENVYADRIILDNVDINTKILFVDVYSNIDNELLKTIKIDIEEARKEKNIELNQTLYNASHGIALNYPGSWTQPDKVSVDQAVVLHSPADVDGNIANVGMERILIKDIESGKVSLDDPDEFENVIKTSIEVSGYTGDDYVYTYAENMKERQIRVKKDDALYFIRYQGETTQFERYFETFEEILKTVSFVEVKEEKSYVAYYMENNNDSWETVKVYEDGTTTVQISEHAREIWKKDISTSTIQANVEYEISGITRASNVKFLIPDEGGAYVGSYVFLWGQGFTDIYLLDMEEAIATGNFIAKKLDIRFWISDYPYVKSTFVDGYEKKLVVVENDYGDEYVISRDGTVEKYVANREDEEKESNNQQTQNNEEYTVLYDKDICTVKQYEKNNRITVEWKDTDYDYQEIKHGSIKTNNEYTITGMQGPVKGVFIIHKDRQDENLPGILFWCENNKIYYVRWDIVHSDSAIDILWEENNITEISQTSGTWLDAMQGEATCTITYMGLTYNLPLTDTQAESYIEKYFQEEVYNDTPEGIKYQVIDIRANGMSDEYYYYDVDLYIINGESTEKTTWGFELLNSNGNIIRRNIVKQ